MVDCMTFFFNLLYCGTDGRYEESPELTFVSDSERPISKYELEIIQEMEEEDNSSIFSRKPISDSPKSSLSQLEVTTPSETTPTGPI